MKWGVETIVDEVSRIVDLNLKQVDENGRIKEWHSPSYDMTFWSTYEEAEANRDDCRRRWQTVPGYTIRG